MHNDAPRAEGAAWLRVRPVGANARALAHGARVVLRRGDERWERELRTAGGFQASVPLEAHFGVAALADAPLTLEVTWPGRGVTRLQNVTPDRVLDVTPQSPTEAPK